MLGGSLLQLGVQRISPDAKALAKSFSMQNRMKRNFDASSSKKQFWHNLGFDFVSSLDYSDFEGAELVWDLNLPIHGSFSERFDVIFDGGTMEHVFNTLSVLGNIDRLLKVGGIVIHEVPSSNSIDHGFYSFSPTMFRDYYLNVGYELIEIFLVVKKGHLAKIYEYFPRTSRTEIPENWGSWSVNVWCVAQKKHVEVQNETPQQSKYLDVWVKAGVTSPDKHGLQSQLNSFIERARTAIELLSKKSIILAVLLLPLRKRKSDSIPLVLKYKVKSGANRDFV